MTKDTFDIELSRKGRHGNRPVFQHLRMQFAENADLFPISKNARLPPFDKARVVRFAYVVVHLQIVQ